MTAVSFVIPAFNAEKTLETCISSLYKHHPSSDFECIVVNDGSRDSTEAICIAFANRFENFKYFTIPNSGVSVARNKGIKMATGKYLCFVDSDDFLVSAVDVSSIYSRSADMILFPLLSTRHPVESGCIDRASLFEWTLDNRHPELNLRSVWSKLYLRSKIVESGTSFPNGINMGEDWLFNLSFVQSIGTCEIDPRIFYVHVENQNGLSSGYNPNYFESDRKFHTVLARILNDKKYGGFLKRLKFEGLLTGFQLCTFNSRNVSSYGQRKKSFLAILNDPCYSDTFVKPFPELRNWKERLLYRIISHKAFALLEFIFRLN